MENKSVKYASQIAPRVEEIRVLCHKLGIPFFMAFGVNKVDEKFDIRCTALIPQLLNVESEVDRRFENFINIQNGFHAVPASTDIDTGKDDYGLPEKFSGISNF